MKTPSLQPLKWLDPKASSIDLADALHLPQQAGDALTIGTLDNIDFKDDWLHKNSVAKVLHSCSLGK